MSHNDIATTDTLSTEANSTTARDVETPTTSTAWKSGICKVPQKEMGVLRSAYCKGESYVVDKYQHARQNIAQKAEETPKTASARLQQVALTSLINPNVMATYIEAAGQGMLYVVDHSNQLTAQHLPTVRALAETATEVGRDLVVTGASQIWQRLPEAVKPTIRQTLVDTGTEIGVMYELLTGNLSEGQKAIADLAIGAATSEVAGSAIAATRLIAQQGKILSFGLENIEGGIIKKMTRPPQPGDILGASTFTMPDGKVIISYDVFGGGKPKIPKPLSGGIIHVEDMSYSINYNALTKYLQPSEITAIKKLEQGVIKAPDLSYVLQNLPEGTPTVKIKEGTKKGHWNVKFNDAPHAHTQIHHAIPQNLKDNRAIKFAEIDIVNDQSNLMTLFTPQGAELATQRYNSVKATYGKYLRELNPDITEQEIEAIVKWRIPTSNRSTHQVRHTMDYGDSIKEKLNDLWKKIAQNKLDREECRQEIYNLMAQLKDGIKDKKIELYRRKKVK